MDLQETRIRLEKYAALNRLEAQRAALMFELFERSLYDHLAAVAELYRVKRNGMHKFYWNKTQPDFWPHQPKLRKADVDVIAYAWIDRNPVDEHRKLFTIYRDGKIYVGPGWELPDHFDDIMQLLGSSQAERQTVFDAVAREAVYRGDDEVPKRPYRDEELQVITQSLYTRKILEA